MVEIWWGETEARFAVKYVSNSDEISNQAADDIRIEVEQNSGVTSIELVAQESSEIHWTNIIVPSQIYKPQLLMIKEVAQRATIDSDNMIDTTAIFNTANDGITQCSQVEGSVTNRWMVITFPYKAFVKMIVIKTKADANPGKTEVSVGYKQCDTNQRTESISSNGQGRIFTDNFYCRGALADVVNINWLITRPFQICKVEVYGTAIDSRLAERAVLLQTPSNHLEFGGNHPRSTITGAFNGNVSDPLDEVSFCGQVYTNKLANDNHETKWIFSYAVKELNPHTASVPFAVGIKNGHIVCKVGSTDVEFEDGVQYVTEKWVDMCISWRSSDGGIKYYRDGELKSTKHISEELLIKRGGTLVLFQMQDSQGQFTEINAFKGKLREAYFFEKQISDKQAKKLADICAKKQVLEELSNVTLHTWEDMVQAEDLSLQPVPYYNLTCDKDVNLTMTCGETMLLYDEQKSTVSQAIEALSHDNSNENGLSKAAQDTVETPTKSITVLKKSCLDAENKTSTIGVKAEIIEVFGVEKFLKTKSSWSCDQHGICTQHINDCQRGTKSEILFSGYQTCTSCNASHREYQPNAGETECKVCFGKLNVSEDTVICQPEYCQEDEILYQLHNKTYLFGRTEAYTTAKSACLNLDGYLHRWCKGGGEWSDQLFDSCKYHCEQETKLNTHDDKQYSFAKTEAGKTARSPCKSDLGGYVYRSCDKGGKWSDKISHQCNTPMTEDINEVRNIVNSGGIKMDGDTATKITTSLGDINNNKEVTTKDAIDKISLVMAIADKLPDEDTNEFSELRGEMAATLESTLQTEADLMNDTVKNNINKAVESIAMSLPEGSPPIEKESLTIQALRPSEPVELLRPKNTEYIQFDPVSEAGERVNVAVMSSRYKSFLPSTNGEKEIDSAVVSVNFVMTASNNRNFSLKFKSKDRRNRTCVYLNPETEQWEETGLTSVNNKDGSHTCVSNHATSFALLLSIEDVNEGDKKAQDALTYAMFVINVIFLSLTFGLVAPFRKFRKKVLTMAQLNMIFALILGNFGFTILSVTTKINVDSRNFPVSYLNKGCITGVIIVQYFFITAIFWMGSCAWALYGKIVDAVRNHGRSEKNVLRNRSVMAWGLSAVFPLVVYLIAWSLTDNKDDYSTPYIGKHYTQDGDCWIETPWRYFSIIVPVFAVLIFNIACFVMITRVIIGAASSPGGEVHRLAKISKGMAAVGTSVGLPWILSILTFGPLASAAQYLFIVLTGLQGPLFFVCMICLQDDIRSHTIELLGLKKYLSQHVHHREEQAKSTLSTENSTVILSKIEGTVSDTKIESIAEEVKEVEDEDGEYTRKGVISLRQMYEKKAGENTDKTETVVTSEKPAIEEDEGPEVPNTAENTDSVGGVELDTEIVEVREITELPQVKITTLIENATFILPKIEATVSSPKIGGITEGVKEVEDDCLTESIAEELNEIEDDYSIESMTEELNEIEDDYSVESIADELSEIEDDYDSLYRRRSVISLTELYERKAGEYAQSGSHTKPRVLKALTLPTGGRERPKSAESIYSDGL